jgi:hypothetical protein
VFVCVFAIRIVNESEKVTAHVAEAVAAAAVAFPLAVDGVFLPAATATADWDVENLDRHSALFLKARMADLES